MIKTIMLLRSTSMKMLGIWLAILAGITGVIAACYWYRSSQVPIDPMWPDGPIGLVEPGETEASQNGWIAGMLQANTRVAELNAKAALWTAGTVLLAAAASIFSAL
jgi:hypothetical protein